MEKNYRPVFFSIALLAFCLAFFLFPTANTPSRTSTLHTEAINVLSADQAQSKASSSVSVDPPSKLSPENTARPGLSIREEHVSFSIQLDCFKLHDSIAAGEKSEDPNVRDNAARARLKILPKECQGLDLNRRDAARLILSAAKAGDIKAQYYFAVAFPTIDVDGKQIKENVDAYVSYLPQLLSERVAAKDPLFMVLASEYFSGCGVLLPSTSITQPDWRPDYRASRQLLEEASRRSAILSRRHQKLLTEFTKFTSPDIPPIQFRCP